MNKQSEISIIVPVFNRTDVLSETLNSILAQTYTNWECIVVNDYSTENLSGVIKQFIEKDDRFKFVNNTHLKGAPGARNSGIDIAKGEWVVLFDSDNLMYPSMLQEMIDLVDQKIDVITCFAHIINSEGDQVGTFEWISDGDIYKELITGETYVDNNIALVRRSKLVEIGGTDENCPSFQEWDTHIRLSKICKYHTCKNFLVDYVQSERDTISGDAIKSVSGYMYILKKYLPQFIENKATTHHGARILENIEQIKDHTEKERLIKEVNDIIPKLKSSIQKAKLKRLIVKSLNKLNLKK